MITLTSIAGVYGPTTGTSSPTPVKGYERRTDSMNGIEHVRKQAPGADIDDQVENRQKQ